MAPCFKFQRLERSPSFPPDSRNPLFLRVLTPYLHITPEGHGLFPWKCYLVTWCFSCNTKGLEVTRTCGQPQLDNDKVSLLKTNTLHLFRTFLLSQTTAPPNTTKIRTFYHYNSNHHLLCQTQRFMLKVNYFVASRFYISKCGHSI